MKIEYDNKVDVAYINLEDNLKLKVDKTYLCDLVFVNGMINLDFDAEGRLIGIEVIDASKKLPESSLINKT